MASSTSIDFSTPGTYDITYTTTNPCQDSSTVSVTVTAMGDATFNYSAASYCVNDALQTPTITGTGGGSFTVIPAAGLVVDPTTGEFDPSTATTGSYDITYTTAGGCVGTETVNVTIDPIEDATFNYSAASYCVSEAAQTPTITGVGGGNFTVTPTTGLAVDPVTGEFDPSISTVGSYDVTYTTAGACPGIETVAVSIGALDDATFNYSAGSYCVDETTAQIPTITGEAGGAFSVTPTAGIVVDPATGSFIPNATTPGTYDITYTTTNPCQDSSTVSVTITSCLLYTSPSPRD